MAATASLSTLSPPLYHPSPPPPANPPPSTSPASPTFAFPSYTTFPPFYTLQPNLTTRARQLDLWSALITSYCAHHRLFRLALSAPPADLFAHAPLGRALKPADVRAVLDHMAQPAHGPRVEWIAANKGEPSSTCWVYWKSLAEWADAVYAWVDATGQKGSVLTVYELREGDAVSGAAWRDMDEALLRKVLGVLVKRGKAQVFGVEESSGVKFF
ncbi:hypothetical protein LTR08_009005 [Meristemomyces frigidus]|nr:hypothetical protein LTR08_009005 [Meristemomyces frigidus]